MLTPYQVALLIILIFVRSEQKRAKLSAKTVKILSKRKCLRVAFIKKLIAELDELGFTFVELESGGFGMLKTTALEGAPSVTVKKYLTEELRNIRKGKITFEQIEVELGFAFDFDDEIE